MNQQARIDIRHSTCPHDCPSACALDIEVIDGRSIGRVRGSKLQTYTADTITIDHDGPGFTISDGTMWGTAVGGTLDGKPYTGDVAIDGDRIVAVGRKAVVMRLRGSKTRLIDLGGLTLMPGFNDAHAHWIGDANEDTDHDGHFETRTVFARGLNLVSGLEVGFGGGAGCAATGTGSAASSQGPRSRSAGTPPMDSTRACSAAASVWAWAPAKPRARAIQHPLQVREKGASYKAR